MGTFQDLTGLKFGYLTVTKRFFGNEPKKVKWLCECICGSVKPYFASNLKKENHSKSCGCKKGEMVSTGKTKHGKRHSPLYSVWKGMRFRCSNSKFKFWEHYGGRGISVDKTWDDFIEFYNWAINSGYSEGLTLDRVNNNGDYSPANCRWITQNEQCKNRRSNIMVGNLCLSDYCFKHKLNYRTIRARVGELGWSVERAIKTPC